ncbi:MAG: SRPBCC family protein [bacterium]
MTIAGDWQKVYGFISDLDNFPLWAKTFCRTIRKLDDTWYEIGTDQGPLRIRVTPRNEFGIIDYHIAAGQGAEVYVPPRMIANGTGCEVQFTLFQRPGMTDEMFVCDRALVEQDLATLKKQME